MGSAEETYDERSHHEHSYDGQPTRQRSPSTEGNVSVLLGPLRSISWGGVIAGTIVALILSLTLSLLGLSFGLGTIDPASEENPFGGVSWLVGSWSVIAALVAFFSSGFVSARLSPNSSNLDGALHGLLSWAIVALIGFYAAGSTIGSLVSGTASVMGQTVQAISSTSALAGSQIAQSVEQALSQSNVSLQDIRSEGRQILRQTEKPSLQPENIRETASSAVGTLQRQGRDAARFPQSAQEELNTAIDRLAEASYGTIEAFDQQAVVNVLTARTELGADEAQRIVSRWAASLSAANQRLQQFGQTVQSQTLEAAEATNEAIASAAFWTFLGLVIGAISAALGGVFGSPDEMSRISRRAELVRAMNRQ